MQSLKTLLKLSLLVMFTCSTFITNAQSFDPNKIYRLTTQWQGDDKSLDVINDGSNNKLHLAKTGNLTGQHWKFTDAGAGFYRLTTAWLGAGRCLEVVNDGTNNKVQMANTGNNPGQLWKVTSLGNGFFRLTSKLQGDAKSLDVINDGTNNKLQMAPTGNLTGQFWKVTSLSENNAPAKNVLVYMPAPANNAFSGDEVTVKFNPQGVSDVTDSKGNRSLNQQKDGAVVLQVLIDGKVAQTIMVLGPKAAPNVAAPSVSNVSAVKAVAFMPPPANNTFSGDVVTVKFNPQGVSDVTDSKGNRSLNQQKDGVVSLELKVDGKKVRTINIHAPK